VLFPAVGLRHLAAVDSHNGLGVCQVALRTPASGPPGQCGTLSGPVFLCGWVTSCLCSGVSFLLSCRECHHSLVIPMGVKHSLVGPKSMSLRDSRRGSVICAFCPLRVLSGFAEFSQAVFSLLLFRVLCPADKPFLSTPPTACPPFSRLLDILERWP
jgi:hypothetical protein